MVTSTGPPPGQNAPLCSPSIEDVLEDPSNNKIAHLLEYDQGYAFVLLILKRYSIDVTPHDFVKRLNAAKVPIDKLFAPLMDSAFPFDKIADFLQVDNVTRRDVMALLMATPRRHPLVRLCSFLYDFLLYTLPDAGMHLHDLYGVINSFRLRAEYLRGMVPVVYREDNLIDDILVYKKAIWREAFDEPCEAQVVVNDEIKAPYTWVAIAHVIRNRALANRPGFGGSSITGVCVKERQFLCWNKLAKIQPGGEQWDDMDKWVRCILDGMMTDPTYGAMHFINPVKYNPSWAKQMKLGARIGSRNYLLGE